MSPQTKRPTAGERLRRGLVQDVAFHKPAAQRQSEGQPIPARFQKQQERYCRGSHRPAVREEWKKNKQTSKAKKKKTRLVSSATALSMAPHSWDCPSCVPSSSIGSFKALPPPLAATSKPVLLRLEEEDGTVTKVEVYEVFGFYGGETLCSAQHPTAAATTG